MIDFTFVLLIAFSLMLFVIVFAKWGPITEGITYIVGFGYFFIGLHYIIDGLSEVSTFLSSSIGCTLWGFGLILLIRTSLLGMETTNDLI